MTRYDRDIDGALNQQSGDTSPKVGDWEPSDKSIGIGVVLIAIFVVLAIWGGMR